MKQTETVLHHLQNIGSLTSLEALKLYGIARLASRVNEARNAGHVISTEHVTKGGKRFAKYAYLRFVHQIAFETPVAPVETSIFTHVNSLVLSVAGVIGAFALVCMLTLFWRI